MGPVMCAAFLEWFLFIAAFNYCLVKVFRKAEHWSIRILAILMMIAFTTLRCVLLCARQTEEANVSLELSFFPS